MKERNKYIVLLAVGIMPFFAELTAQEIKVVDKQSQEEVIGSFAFSEEELIANAMERNFQIKIQGLEARSAKVLKATAFELPKAEVSAQYGHYDGPDNNLAFEISQTLPFPTLFWAKAKQLKAGSQTAELKLQMQKNEVRQAVRVLYEQLRHKQHQAYYKDLLSVTYGRYYDLVSERYKLGEATKQEQTIAKIKMNKAHFEHRQLQLEISALHRKLELICGVKGFEIPISKVLESRPFEWRDFRKPMSENLTVQYLNSQINELRAEKNVSLSEQLPDITLGYQNSSAVGIHTIDGKDVNYGIRDRLNSFSLGLSIPLNIFASRAKVKATKLKMKAKEEEAHQVDKEMQAEYQQLMDRYDKANLRYQHYQFKALPEAEELLKLAEESYKLGETTYLDYVQALETVDDIREAYINYSLELNLCIINIYALFNK